MPIIGDMPLTFYMKLQEWEEACGTFVGMRKEHGKTIVTLEYVGNIEVEKDIDIDIDKGQSIGILRTETGYRVREM